MTHALLTESSLRAHGRLTTGSGSGMGSGNRKGKERLRMQAIATYPTRAIATDCLPMEQR